MAAQSADMADACGLGVAAFARRWEPGAPVSLVDSPGEKACGDWLMLHPAQLSRPAPHDSAQCCLALSVLHAGSGRVVDLRLRAPRCWGGRGTAGTDVSRAFPSCTRSMLTEIYLCHDCSCHDIEDGNAGAGGG
jgi:hypothetical protein